VGDHVRRNSGAGCVTGTIIAIHTQDFDYNGRRRASPDDPRYEIRLDRIDHIAAHRGARARAPRRPWRRMTHAVLDDRSFRPPARRFPGAARRRRHRAARRHPQFNETTRPAAHHGPQPR
jgi:hypothetical protein